MAVWTEGSAQEQRGWGEGASEGVQNEVALTQKVHSSVSSFMSLTPPMSAQAGHSQEPAPQGTSLAGSQGARRVGLLHLPG